MTQEDIVCERSEGDLSHSYWMLQYWISGPFRTASRRVAGLQGGAPVVISWFILHCSV